MEILEQASTVLSAASLYGVGAYGTGTYGGPPGGGNYVVLNPIPYGVVWEPIGVIVTTDSTSFTIASAYLDITEPFACVGTTPNGNQDTIDLPAIEVTANHRLIVVWFGGDPGSNAFATLIGDLGGGVNG